MGDVRLYCTSSSRGGGPERVKVLRMIVKERICGVECGGCFGGRE